jgi:hypothetical protein
LFSSNIGFANALVAEATAILKACQLCYLSLGLRRKPIFIFSDSKVSVSWVNGDGDAESVVASIFNEIRSFLALLFRVRVVFLPRIRNFVADSLAKRGSGAQEEVLLWDFG